MRPLLGIALAMAIVVASLYGEEVRPSPGDIKEFVADTYSPDYFKNFKVSQGRLQEVLKQYFEVLEERWQHHYSHVGEGIRTGHVILRDGRKLGWMVKPGGLAWLDFPSGKRMYLAAEAGTIIEHGTLTTPWSHPTVHGLQTRLVFPLTHAAADAAIPGYVELRHKDGTDWAQNSIGDNYKGAIVVTGGLGTDGRELARHVYPLKFNTIVPAGKAVVLCRFDLHDKPYNLDKPGNYIVRFAGFRAGDLANKGMVDLPGTDMEFEVAPHVAR
ncbi:MAG: hypothetical protein ABR915_05755 [Thermoguttaceae bacterium]